METRAHYVAVGAFVMAMVVLAFVAVLWLARGALNTQVAHYDMYFRGPVTGLRDGAEVDYNGVPVGKVVDIKIVPFNQGQDKSNQAITNEAEPETESPENKTPATMVRVTAAIDDTVEVKQDARASVESNILSGVSYILVVGGSRDAPLLMAKGDQRYPVIPSHRSRLASVAARAPELLNKLNDAVEKVNALLDEKNRKALADTLANLDSFSQGLAERRQDIADLTTNANAAVKAADTLLEDIDRSYVGRDGLGEEAKAAIADFDRVAKGLNDTNRQLQQALVDVRPGLRTFSQQTLGNVGSLVTEARQLVTGLNRVADGLERDPSRVLFGDRREGYRLK